MRCGSYLPHNDIEASYYRTCAGGQGVVVERGGRAARILPVRKIGVEMALGEGGKSDALLGRPAYQAANVGAVPESRARGAHGLLVQEEGFVGFFPGDEGVFRDHRISFYV